MALFILLFRLRLLCFDFFIFFLCGQTAPDMAFGFVHVQHDPRLGRQRGVDMLQAVGHILVDCGLTDPKFSRRLPHRCIVVYDVIGYGHRTLFDILLQGVPPEYVFYSICKGMREYVWTNLLAGYFFILFQSPASLFPTFLPYCHIPFLFTSASSFADLNLCFRKSSLSPSS